MKRNFTFCLLLYFGLTSVLAGQSLERKGSLGAQIGLTEDGQAILINRVLDNSTAAAIGLKANDILKTVNGTSYTTLPDLVGHTTTWRAGQKIQMEVLRDGTTTALNGLVKGKPFETSEHGEVIYGAVPFEGGLLRSILELPHAVKNPPVLFFLQGFGCSSIDAYANPLGPVKQLVEGLVAQGIAVFRVEKPGLGDSKDTPDCAEIGYHLEVDAFTKSLKTLKSTEGIDADKIYLFGHSLGGVTAPLLAERIPVKGIVNYGSVATTWYEYLLKVLREQEVMQGTDLERIEEVVRLREPILHDYLVKKMTPEQLMANPAYRDHLSTGLPLLQNGQTLGRHYTFMQEINETNITKAFKRANTYFLGIHGEFDLHAIDEEWAEDVAELVNYYHPGKGEWMVLPGTEHGFSKVASMAENVRLRQAGLMNMNYMSKNFNPELVEVVANWIQKISKMDQNG